jgi:hypothetical protein
VLGKARAIKPKKPRPQHPKPVLSLPLLWEPVR